MEKLDMLHGDNLSPTYKEEDKKIETNKKKQSVKMTPSKEVDIKKKEILAYKVILAFKEYKNRLNSYELDEQGQVVVNIYSKRELAEMEVNKLASKGLLSMIEEVYRKV